ncbi:MAG: Crp/Fnr family transcriptional regulator [Syntrophobacteraceae bacterium]
MVELSELKTFGLLITFSNQQLQEIAKIADRKFFRTDASIYVQSQSAKELFLVEKGLVSLRAPKSKDGLMISFALCEPGDLFGASSLLKGEFYTLDAVCLEDTVVLVINAEKLSRLCEADYEFGYNLMKKIARLYLDRYEAARSELGFPCIVDRKRKLSLRNH